MNRFEILSVDHSIQVGSQLFGFVPCEFNVDVSQYVSSFVILYFHPLIQPCLQRDYRNSFEMVSLRSRLVLQISLAPSIDSHIKPSVFLDIFRVDSLPLMDPVRVMAFPEYELVVFRLKNLEKLAPEKSIF